MSLILLEALAALVVLLGIVWWTMFSGRHSGELDAVDASPMPLAPPMPATAGRDPEPPASATTRCETPPPQLQK